jgi:hypothetical protein
MSGPMDVAILLGKKAIIANAYCIGFCFGFSSLNHVTYVFKNHFSAGQVGIAKLHEQNVSFATLGETNITCYHIYDLSANQLRVLAEALCREDNNALDLEECTSFQCIDRIVEHEWAMLLSIHGNASSGMPIFDDQGYSRTRFIVNTYLSKGNTRFYEMLDNQP